MKKLFLLFPFFFIFTYANTITLDYLKKQPNGISRDFYIWLYLQQNITPKEASEAYELANKKNQQLFRLYYKKGDNKTLSRKTHCEQMNLQVLLKQDSQCIAYALTLKKMESLDRQSLLKLAKKLSTTHSTLSKNIEILASKNPFNLLIQTDANNFADFYFKVSPNYRHKLNQYLPIKTLKNYLKAQNTLFQKALRHIILNPAMHKFNQSLTSINPQEILPYIDAEIAFYLGLNAAKYHKNQKALTFFNYSTQKAKYAFYKNRGTFWAYLISQDTKYLQTLAQSKSVDIYSLASLELTNAKAQFTIVRDIDTKNALAQWNTHNPFEWQKIKDSYKTSQNKAKLLEEVNYSNTKAHYVWLNKQKEIEYFLMPYKEIFSAFPPDKQALLYALGRQESLFIPTAISTSYALGLMQLMPFNVTAIAKELGESDKVSYLDMFNPAINVPYAEYFTRPLEREFKHPLFISYAYNGGPGFTRSLLGKNYLFKKSNPLDPWYSMEMIPYEETRTYGKKVLANYVIYQQGFGNDVKLLDLLDKTLIY
ncbi:MAG: lytic transglycosylase domain-containing protein [Helicobacter sp.]|nr:lytic transglycosylase domain-containing protein [Helicobacter sp.]